MTTHILGAIATVYGIYGACAILLQAHQMLIRHESCDVSLKFLVSATVGYVIWLVYGVSAHSLPLVISDSVGLVCDVVTLVIAFTLRASCVPVARKGHL